MKSHPASALARRRGPGPGATSSACTKGAPLGSKRPSGSGHGPRGGGVFSGRNSFRLGRRRLRTAASGAWWWVIAASWMATNVRWRASVANSALWRHATKAWDGAMVAASPPAAASLPKRSSSEIPRAAAFCAVQCARTQNSGHTLESNIQRSPLGPCTRAGDGSPPAHLIMQLIRYWAEGALTCSLDDAAGICVTGFCGDNSASCFARLGDRPRRQGRVGQVVGCVGVPSAVGVCSVGGTGSEAAADGALCSWGTEEVHAEWEQVRDLTQSVQKS